MKKVLSAVVVSSLIACQNSSQKNISDSQKFLDSLKIASQVDSMVKATVEDAERKAIFDTIGLWKAPVKVTSAKMVRESEYSNYKSIQLSYKNVSDKKITAIRFHWYGLNSFNEPADMGSYTLEGFGGGFTDDPIGPGKTDYGTWSILSKDGKKVELAWPYEVAFEDGTKWKL